MGEPLRADLKLTLDWKPLKTSVRSSGGGHDWD
jgi:hypothetical protein